MDLDAGAALNWYGVSGLSWDVDPGTYWVAFVPDANISGYLPGFAPDPLSQYAQDEYSNNWQGGADEIQVGVRVDGVAEGAAAPDGGSTFILALVAVTGLLVARRRLICRASLA
jgi:hypothetical protein